ncbi:hypothetical protein BOTBODRAFT_573497 [Botryobasidium botryosum FD-172 SS1]|uniref:Uncharacterized protein n=1 Tax=Botryobasidium botryosum (strain FD-172 SS1) TaxID=930990 RepID=A0A067LXT8_BOTB1|nr:hypothetical protein BOTBODRAFT_573497 [Botryobasidium botryosum FD-172 SS1]
MVKVSILDFITKGIQILVQERSPRVKGLDPSKLSEDSTVHADEWPSEAWAAGWGEAATVTHSSGYSIVPTGLWSPEPVLVRGEYEDIWKHIKNQLRRPVKDAGGLVVWGQPGIGKLSFLQFALAKAFERKYPVALCNRNGSLYFFSEHGPQLIPLAALDSCVLPDNTLVLYDSHGSGEPPSNFTDPESTAFVVQAASPRVTRWNGWRKRRGAHDWTMDLWAEKEIVAAK